METINTDQEMRNGSVKLLKTFTIRLSLVTASICGPGNCPSISIPCIGEETRSWSPKTKQKEAPKGKEAEEQKNLLLDSEGIDVAIGDTPSEEPVRIITCDPPRTGRQAETEDKPEGERGGGGFHCVELVE
ncbi:hypothetical protein B296_00052656 [Ensete ventricosum]|uniref:Uncharacterized protein n=1 Tax=Ensete ventricosum TaxID=4639 RepID=A0A426X0I5_ENSVE|nr:hypothetical protein B296_00052656 [Ensete ventricosum]